MRRIDKEKKLKQKQIEKEQRAIEKKKAGIIIKIATMFENLCELYIPDECDEYYYGRCRELFDDETQKNISQVIREIVKEDITAISRNYVGWRSLRGAVYDSIDSLSLKKTKEDLEIMENIATEVDDMRRYKNVSVEDVSASGGVIEE